MRLHYPRKYKLANLLLNWFDAVDRRTLSERILGHRTKVVDMIRVFHGIPTAFPRHGGPRHLNQTPGTHYEGPP